MSTEQELYNMNVPQGDTVFEFGDWSSTQSVITATGGTEETLYVNTIGFMIATGAAITGGTIEITGGDLSISIDDIAAIFAYADPFSLKSVQMDGTNNVIVGEIKFNPPVQVETGSTFDITPTGLGLTAGAYGPYLSIKGWSV